MLTEFWREILCIEESATQEYMVIHMCRNVCECVHARGICV